MKTNGAVQTERKRLSLDDFKLEQVNHLGKVVATDLSSLFGGGSSTQVCCDPPAGSGGSQDDCHS